MSLGAFARRAYVASGVRGLLPMRAKLAARRVWVRAARRIGYPISSSRVPRPMLAPHRKRFRLSHALLASDLNPRYVESWPLTARAWEEVVGIEPVLVLIAREADVPDELRADPRVRIFEPLPDLHSAFQAQCIRLLYPALLDAAGAVLISDVELVPIRPDFFRQTVAALDERFFIAYRGEVLYDRGEIAIPYNAARPGTWGEIFGIASLDDVRRRLAEWGAGIAYDGARGGAGWYTDQFALFGALTSWPEASTRLWMLDDTYTRYRRLERSDLMHAAALTDELRRDIRAGRFTDFDACVPHSEYAALNDAILDFAVEVHGVRPRRGAVDASGS